MKTQSWLRAFAPSALSVLVLLNTPAASGAGAVPEGLTEPMMVFVMQMTPEGGVLARSLIGREIVSREDAIEALWRMRERAPTGVRTEFETRMRQIDARVKKQVNTDRVDLDAEVLTRMLVQRGLKTSGTQMGQVAGTIEFLPNEIATTTTSYSAARDSFLDTVVSPNRYRAWDRSSVIETGRAGKSLARARMATLDLTAIRLEGVNLKQIEGQYADFSGASLARSSFRDANLPWAGFNAADLYRVDLREARLSWSLMEHANLTEARLERSMMSGVRMYRANLTRVQANDSFWFAADLSRAKLVGADLRGADFRSVDLRGADLSGARVDSTRFENAFYDRETVLPFSVDEATRRGMFQTSERIHGE